MTRLAIAAAALFAGVASPAVADDSSGPGSLEWLGDLWKEQRVSGVWRTNYFHSSKTFDDETGFFGSTLQVKALPSLADAIDGKLEARVWNSEIGEGGETEARLIEGYATVHFARADLRLGKQIVAWGRADGLNPTDNLTPRDFTLLLPFEGDQRFGTTAARLDVFASQEHTVTVYASPYFEPARIPLPADQAVVEIEPEDSLENTTVGVRLDRVGETLDWSVSYVHGFSLSPTARFIPGPAGELQLELHHDKINVYGADFARNFGRFGVRGEVAYVDTADESGADPGVRNSYLYWIIGVDRTFFANMNVNLQLFGRAVRDHRDSEDAGPGQLAAVINGERDAFTHGVTFRVSNRWLNDSLEAEIFGVGHLERGDGFLRPFLTYAFDDRWTGSVGAEIYFGDDTTEFGLQEPNNGAFLELRYGF